MTIMFGGLAALALYLIFQPEAWSPEYWGFIIAGSLIGYIIGSIIEGN